jgi:hypothetical protein
MSKKPLKFERKLISPTEFAAMPSLCAWAGCTASYEGRQLPSGWYNLMIWSGPVDPNRTTGDIAMSKDCLRDHVLCPEHSQFFALPKVDERLAGLPGGPPLTEN